MRIANVDMILLKEMPAPVDGARLHNQDHYVEDQVMLLDVILLTSLITRLNIILSVENYADIKKAVLMVFLELSIILTNSILMVSLLLLEPLVNMCRVI